MCAAVVLAVCICLINISLAVAQTPKPIRSDSFLGLGNDNGRHSAIQALPLEKLDTQGRAKAQAVLSNITVFRRMPARVIDCDPELYLFLMRQPDVVVNIWSALKISQLDLHQTGRERFRLKEDSGIEADLQYLYSSRDTQLIYADGVYDGGILPRAVKGSGLFLVKSGYVREEDGRCYISTRMDAFLSVEPGAVELVTKAIHPLVGKTADNNFLQTVSFVGSLSRTIESNSHSMQRLALQLDGISPEVRGEFAKMTREIPQKALLESIRESNPPTNVAHRNDDKRR